MEFRSTLVGITISSLAGRVRLYCQAQTFGNTDTPPQSSSATSGGRVRRRSLSSSLSEIPSWEFKLLSSDFFLINTQFIVQSSSSCRLPWRRRPVISKISSEQVYLWACEGKRKNLRRAVWKGSPRRRNSPRRITLPSDDSDGYVNEWNIVVVIKLKYL